MRPASSLFSRVASPSEATGRSHETNRAGATKTPRISIVTPSYNQADYLEATIRSVLDQGYANLDYVVIDGGSTDGSVEIIKRYADRLSFWTSGRDGGQSDAINKGFARTDGDVMGWVNSDDLLTPGALAALVADYRPGLRWYHGHAGAIWSDGSETMPAGHALPRSYGYDDFLFGGAVIPQISTFWNRELWERVGGAVLDHSLIMDYDLWARFAAVVPSTSIGACLGVYREHPAAKTGTQQGRARYRRAMLKKRMAMFAREVASSVGNLRGARLLGLCGQVAQMAGRQIVRPKKTP